MRRKRGERENGGREGEEREGEGRRGRRGGNKSGKGNILERGRDVEPGGGEGENE